MYSSNISHDIVKHETMWKVSESNDINEVLKTHVMMLNDLMIMFISLSLILLVLRLLTAHNWDLKSLILETSLFSISVHIMVNKINCTQGP
jgi:mannose/fructose/N-acetylgalactosamine-specific phosphotransferase system component IID